MIKHDVDPEPVAVHVELTDVQALALAQFVKRLTFAEARACAVDEAEAYRIIDAVGRLQDALGVAGYRPR